MYSLIRRLTSLVFLAMFFTVTADPAPPFMRLPPMSQAPTLDGRIEPGEWDSAFFGTGVAQHARLGLDPIQVEYGFGYHENRIYLAGRMETRPGEIYDRKPRRLAGGGPTGHFEFLVDPVSQDPDKNWVQAMLYPLGVVNNIGYSQRIGGFVPFDVAWEYADSWQDGWWTVELSAPADALQGARLEQGGIWGVLFAGQVRGAVNYFSGTVGEPFANRSRYYKFILDEQAPLVQVTEIGDVLGETLSPTLKVRNTLERQLRVNASFYLTDQPEKAPDAPPAALNRLSLAPGESKTSTWRLPVPGDPGAKWLHMEIVDAENGTTYFAGLYKLTRPRSPKWADFTPPPVEPILLEAYFLPYFHRVRAVADFGGLESPDTVAAVHWQVTDGEGRELAAAETSDFANLTAESVLQVPETLAVGTYTVTGRLVDKEGKQLASRSDTFEKADYPFEHNTIGVSHEVLAPWSPIVTAGSVLEVWNRRHDLSAGLPVQIESAGAELLAAPIHLVATSGGERRILTAAGGALSGDGVTASSVSHGTFGPLTARIDMQAEFDGMLKYAIELVAAPESQLESLDLVIPLKAEHAQFLHAAGDGCRTNYSHALPEGEGRVWDSTQIVNWTNPTSFLTYVWLGDHERGLCWWADSAEGWTLPRDKDTPVVEIFRRDGRVELVFHIVNYTTAAAWKGAEARRLVFALEATPVRPRAPWARDIGLCDAGVTRQQWPRFDWIGWTGWCFKGQEKENYPTNYTFAHLRPINDDAAKALAEHTAQIEKDGRKTLVYTDMRARSLIGEMEKAYAWEWAPTTGDRRKSVIMNAPHHAAYQISSTPSRIDYDMWCFQLGMDLGIDYWYFDEIQNEGQYNPATGLGYLDELGREMPTTRLFAYRDLWKRLYTLMQQRGQEIPIIVMHNTSTTYAGPMAFCTTTWDYEEINADPEQRQLTKFGMDYLITETMGHQYGFVASTLGPGGKFEPWSVDQPGAPEKVARHWMGVHMLLDMNPYLTSNAQVRHALGLLGDFGWNQPDAVWIPYWKSEELYTWSPVDHVYVSAYRRGSDLLLVALNDTNAAVTVEWKAAAGVEVEGALDAEQPEEGLEVTAAGRLAIELEAYDYRLVRLRIKP